MRKTILTRLLISMIVGILFSALVTELAFKFQGNTSSRPPKTVELVIPAGTAQKVAQGKSVLPVDMVFVVGDTLVVRNEDTVNHSLGPLFIPSGSSASLSLGQSENLVYACSFQPGRSLGLDVREALTLGLRLQGILIAGTPLGLLLGVYSLVAWPLSPKAAQAATLKTPPADTPGP